MKLTKAQLKKMIIKEIRSTLKESYDDSDFRNYADLIRDISSKLEEALEMAKSLGGRGYDEKHLRDYMIGIDSLLEVIESDLDEPSYDEGDDDEDWYGDDY